MRLDLARVVLILLLACAPGRLAAEDSVLSHRVAIVPVPSPPQDDARKIALGQKLFSDPILSRDKNVSCASCHDLDGFGADTAATDPALSPDLRLNTPTVFNVSLAFRLGWRGDQRTLLEQAVKAILNPAIMGLDEATLSERLMDSAAYRPLFAAIYGGTPSIVQVGDALQAFERQLVTPNSRFDRYLAGDSGAITPTELEGYRRFQEYGCIACHQGRDVGGNLYQRFGIFGDPNASQPSSRAALGRYDITHDEADRGVFRVPSLRNVAETAPYFHDGSVATLDGAIQKMSGFQLGRELDSADVALIADFLRTLTARPPILEQKDAAGRAMH
ncbi:cytochrome c peroxidase [Arboricoccus pini]|uniref:Cytochrome c peroxidase n=1 Tax=Arboricoccus pini TaxID=1963835 RepID=A0A212RQH8_9PROT|nr:cytochrome c peroxidase [Arboricoccus pini]SNB74679.1 cytochrome c peroxidase [Arboricoccus pini]